MAGPWEKYGSQPTGRGQVFSLPPDPQTVRDNGRQDRNDAFSHQMEQKRLDLARAAQMRADQAARDAASVRKIAEQKAQMELQAKQADLRGGYDQMRDLQRSLKDLRNQYNTNFKGQPASRAFGFAELLPAKLRPANGVFNDTANSLLADLAKAKGLTSQQFNTPVEQQMFFSPMIPKASDTDEQIAHKIDQLQRLVNQGTVKYMNQLGIKPQARGNPPATNKTIDFNDLP